MHFSKTQANLPTRWESEVLYQIFPRSFRDSNGDGHGDFKGIEQGLPALKDLGVTMILINPIYKSRVYHNYFADDWTQPDPKFGTMQEMKEMLSSAHKLGMKVILDFEPQYVADQHPWNLAAKQSLTTAPGSFLPNVAAPNPDGKSPWYDGAQIGITQVNLANPEACKAIEENAHFWIDQGFDGLRIDHLMDDLDWQGKATGLFKKLWQPLTKSLLEKHPNLFLVGEQAEWESFRASIEAMEQIPLTATYNFRQRLFLMLFNKSSAEKVVNEYNWFVLPGRAQVSFLENHDLTRFASDVKDPKKQRLAAAWLFAMRGIPMVYQGQELGMKGRLGSYGTDGNDIPVRLGYRWSKKIKDGITPQWYAGTGPWAEERFSVDNDGIDLETQAKDPNSLYNWYKKLIDIRKSHAALRSGTQQVIQYAHESVVVVKRESGEESLTVVANFDSSAASAPGLVKEASRDLLTGRVYPAGSALKLGPWGMVILAKNGKLN